MASALTAIDDPTPTAEPGAGSVPCPVCASTTVPLFQVHGYWICDCSSCGHRLTDLEPDVNHVVTVYGDDYFQNGDAGYPDYVGQGDLVRERGIYYAGLMERFAQPGSVLDVGAAAGFLLQGFIEAGWNGRGIEPNARMAAHARDELGIEVARGTLEEVALERTFDLLCMVQVVAHFHDLQRAFTQAARMTRRGGYWLIETWDRSSLTARLFGRRWHEYSPPSVLHFFSKSGLARTAAQFGFRPVADGRPPRRINIQHAQSLLAHKLEPSNLARGLRRLTGILPESLSIPYPGNDLFWMLLQRE